ncbi:VWA domain-containing protein [Actinoplanes sp. NPDC048967]|uniref:vWA domain-containing protein n=1 Tax=Actinoplanes sp. NPDC048967 TaxID=3155269 RepID=UPI0033F67222
MTVRYPFMLVVAVVVTVAAVWAYLIRQRRRTAALAAFGVGGPGGSRRGAVRRHLPYALLLAALPLLLGGLARPQATIDVPRVSGTVVLVFDVSNSMAAQDVAPNRLAAAQAAATSFVEEQPDTVDIGVVVFGDQALTTQAPTDDHAAALAAINRLTATGGTSLGQAILAALTTITGKPVTLPEAGAAPPQLGYWGSASVVVLSDGEDTGDPAQAEAAADLAAAAGVRIQTVGVGTTAGATVQVAGYQLATRLNEQVLRGLADATGGTYLTAGDSGALAASTRSIDLKLTSREESVELTAPVAGLALLLLAAGALLMIRWHGRIV